jgi:molecular chaperone DnaJ
VQVDVETPQNLNRKQRELLKEFEKASTAATHPQTTSFLSKIKAFWDSFGKA